jgi:hypothetical protein
MAEPATPKMNLGDRVLTLEGKVDALALTLASIEHKIDAASLTQRGDRRYVWGVVVSVVGLLLVPSITGLTVTLGLYVSSQMGPVQQEVTAIKGDIQSLYRVQDMNVQRSSKNEAELEAEMATRRSQWVEQETQLDALSQSTNAQVTDLYRWLSVLWNKNPDLGPFPTEPRPQSNISNRRMPSE